METGENEMSNRDRYCQSRSDRMNEAFNGGRTVHNIKRDEWQMPYWAWALIGVFFAIIIIPQI